MECWNDGIPTCNVGIDHMEYWSNGIVGIGTGMLE
jgi:hypothetical protein